MELKNLTIEKAHEGLLKGDFSVRELVESALKTAHKKNGDLNAFREIYSNVEDQILRAEEMFNNGTATVLTGVPIALKDNILFKGHKAGACSKILENYTATYDAHVVELLKKEGVIFIGRTNMDEFAMGSSTENSAYGITKNPYDNERVAGGSSGGSAAAVAMDAVLASLGSDTGGSIRQPAGFCGLVGLKPTYGTVSRSGLMAMASSLDQIGPFTKNVSDAEVIFNAINSHDPKDSTSVKESDRNKGIEMKKKIGVPRDFVSMDGISEETRENFEKSVKKLESEGYEIVDIKIPSLAYALSVYYILMPAEVSSNLGRFDGLRYGNQVKGKDLLSTYLKTRGEGFGKEARRRILLGTYVLSHGYYDAYYTKALKVQSLIRSELNKALEEVDAIATPTTPTPAFKIGEKTKDPLSMYLSDIFTVAANVGGHPAISIPAGFTKDGLPLDFHLVAPHFREDILFKIGRDFEK